jgi:hypothetical protein
VGQPENTWPLCLACWRLGVSMVLAPPRSPGWPEEKCTVCDRRTNQGIHVDEATLQDAVVLLVRAGVIHSSRSLVIQRETVGGREEPPSDRLASEPPMIVVTSADLASARRVVGALIEDGDEDD